LAPTYVVRSWCSLDLDKQPFVGMKRESSAVGAS
jgi:hypothetical protein